VSRENVEIVQRAYAAYSRGDLDGAVADFAPECEYAASGAVPGAGDTYLGPEGYKRFLASFNEGFDQPRAELHEVVEAGDRVLVPLTLHGRGRQSGAETTWQFWQVWELGEGRFVRGQGFTTEAEALDAVGLSE
jgi:ketosteroid isomerase-like protein